MHPLRHPRNAIFLGLIFIVIGFIYWVVPYVGRLAHRLRRRHDARHPRDRDGADVLRPHRRVSERLGRFPPDDRAGLELPPRICLPVRHPGLGRPDRAPAGLHRDPRDPVPRSGWSTSTRRSGRGASASRGSTRSRRPTSTCRARPTARSSVGIATFFLFAGVVFGGWLIAFGLIALVASLLYWGREALRDYDHVADMHPTVVPPPTRHPAAGRPRPGPDVPAVPRLARPGPAVRRPRLRRLAAGHRHRLHDRDAARLAQRRPQGVPEGRRGGPDRPHREPAGAVVAEAAAVVDGDPRSSWPSSSTRAGCRPNRRPAASRALRPVRPGAPGPAARPAGSRSSPRTWRST